MSKSEMKPGQAYIVFPGSGVAVPVPDIPDDEEAAWEAEQAALDASPEFRAMMERANRDIAEGRTKPAEQVYRELGIGEPSYDAKSDTAYVPLADGPFGHTVEEPHRTIDYNQEGAVFGVEFRTASQGVDFSGLPEADAREIAAALHRLGVPVTQPVS